MEERNIVASICARGGSKGVPRKNLKKLNGIPLVGLAIECARNASIFDSIVVSTDDQEIAEIGRAYGAEVPFLRPDHLATDDSSKWMVFRHLVEEWEQSSGTRVDVLVDLDVGVPLRSPDDVRGAVSTLLGGDADVVNTAYEPERNPYFNMVELDGNGYAHISKRPEVPIVARQQAPAVYSLSPSAIAMRRNALWDYEHWSQAKLKVYVVPRERAVDVDTALDFQFVEFLSGQSHG